jgi:YVTN family beta-propeller protein
MTQTVGVLMLVAVLGTLGCGGMRSSPRVAEAPPSGAVLATVRLPDLGNDVATGADGRAYVAMSSNKLVIVDTTTATVTATIDVDGEPDAVAVTPDGRRAFLVDLAGEEVAVVDTVQAKQLTTIPMGTRERPSQRPSAVASRDGTRVYVGNTAKDHVYVIDTAANQVVTDFFLDFHPAEVAIRSDGRYLFVAGCRLACTDGTLAIIDTTSFKTIAKIPLKAVPTGLVVTPDGSKAYVANGREASVTVVNLATQAVLEDILVGPEPVGLALAPAGKAVYVTSFRDGSLSEISTARNDVVATVKVGASPRSVVVNRDGTRAFLTHSSNTLSIVDLGRLGGVHGSISP